MSLAIHAYPDCVGIVSSFDELMSTPFAGPVNALCWPRQLDGDFDAIVHALAQIDPLDEILSLDDEDLASLSLTPAGERARTQLLADRRLLSDAGLDPLLDCIPAYPKDDPDAPVGTDVYSFHADSANTLADTLLCSYNQASSEGVPNRYANRKVDDPKIRAALLADHGGPDDAAFAAHLARHHYDLHYAATADAPIFSFGLHNLWRIATQNPASPVPPCIHRAPTTKPGQLPRLLLIS